MRKPKSLKSKDDNPEWTKAMFARARKAREAMPDVVAHPPRIGRPKAEHPLKVVSVRIDAAALEAFRGQGKGWQKLARAALEREAKRLKPLKRGAV